MKLNQSLALSGIAFLLSIPGLTLGQAGTTIADFLKVGTGARGPAMANAFTAAVNDSTAIYWNPAGLALAPALEISLTHNEWLQGTGIDSLALSNNFGSDGTVGIGLTTLGIRSFMSTLEGASGNYVGTGPLATAAYYSISLGYGKKLDELMDVDFLRNTSIGLKANLVSQNLDGLVGEAFSFDLGAMKSFPAERITLGLDVQNIGTSIQGGSEPLIVKGGVSWTHMNNFDRTDVLLLDADMDLHSDTGFQPRLGGEYKVRVDSLDVVAIRAGLRTTDDQYGLSFMAFGVGLERSFEGFILGVDYAFLPYGAIGTTHFLTLNLQFNPGLDRLSPRPFKVPSGYLKLQEM